MIVFHAVICYYECMYFSTLCIEPKGIHVFLTIVTLVMVPHACMHILHYMYVCVHTHAHMPLGLLVLADVVSCHWEALGLQWIIIILVHVQSVHCIHFTFLSTQLLYICIQNYTTYLYLYQYVLDVSWWVSSDAYVYIQDNLAPINRISDYYNLFAIALYS